MLKQIEISFRKLLLKILLLFSKNHEQKTNIKLPHKSKLLFIRLNRIGDALVTTPLLSLVKSKINCEIHVLASRSNSFIFSDCGFIDNVIVFKKDGNNLKSIIKLINEENYDAVIDLHDDVSTTVSFLIYYVKTVYKIGFRKNTAKLYNYLIEKPDSKTTHVVDRILTFLSVFNLTSNLDEINIQYYAKETSMGKAGKFLDENKLGSSFLLGINISAGSDARFWGVEKYSQLIESLLNTDISLVLLCEPKDVNKANLISGGAIPIYYQNSFNEFCGIIPHLNLLFTPDTSIVHVASAYKIPIFGLYVKYKTTDMVWSPYRSENQLIVTEEPNLQNITLNEVKKKLIPFIEKVKNG